MSEYKLRKAGVAVTLNETKGRRFMIMQKAQTPQAALAERIGFMKKVLENGTQKFNGGIGSCYGL